MPRFVKGSQEAKDFMASLRAKRGMKKGGGDEGSDVMDKIKKSLEKSQEKLQNQAKYVKRMKEVGDAYEGVKTLVGLKNSTPSQADLDYLSMSPPPSSRPTKNSKK